MELLQRYNNRTVPRPTQAPFGPGRQKFRDRKRPPRTLPAEHVADGPPGVRLGMETAGQPAQTEALRCQTVALSRVSACYDPEDVLRPSATNRRSPTRSSD